MSEPSRIVERTVELDALGEDLSKLRLCERASLEAMRRSLATYGQLGAIAVFPGRERLEILDGFKRVRAARALSWSSLWARVLPVGPLEAKLTLGELHAGRSLCELEEGWLVRSLHRDDGVSLPQIAHHLSRHRSWVWRRLMLVESLEPSVQLDVRLGLVAARAAVAVSRLPRGNQEEASAVVSRRGLTVRQTELLVEELLGERNLARQRALLTRWLEMEPPQAPSGPRPGHVARGEADWMSADVVRVRDVASRLEARLLATPLCSLTPAASELLRDALVGLVPVLRALDAVIVNATREGLS